MFVRHPFLQSLLSGVHPHTVVNVTVNNTIHLPAGVWFLAFFFLVLMGARTVMLAIHQDFQRNRARGYR